MRRVLRYEVPADDTSHLIGAGPILMTTPWRQAASSPAGRLEVWVQVEVADDWPATREERQSVQVFRTGHPIPDGAIARASCLDGFLVWHLYEVPAAFAAEATA